MAVLAGRLAAADHNGQLVGEHHLPPSRVGQRGRHWNGCGTQCIHPAQEQPFLEPGGSAWSPLERLRNAVHPPGPRTRPKGLTGRSSLAIRTSSARISDSSSYSITLHRTPATLASATTQLATARHPHSPPPAPETGGGNMALAGKRRWLHDSPQPIVAAVVLVEGPAVRDLGVRTLDPAGRTIRGD